MTVRPFIVLAGVLSFSVPFAFYLATLAPSITFDDSGELITACAALGIPHPPGYPLFVNVGHLFTLLPGMRAARAVNLASAAAGGAAAAAVFALAWQALAAWRGGPGTRAAAAAVAGITFALSRTFWSQAVVTEVYTLQALMLALTLWLALKWLEGSGARWGYAAAFSAGLAVAAHTSFVLVLAALVLYVLWRKRKDTPNEGAFRLALFFVWGVGVFLFLPLRSAREPLLDWGHPSTWRLFWAHVTRAAYGGPVGERLVFLPHHLKELGGLVISEVSPAALFLAAVGLAAGVAGRRRPFGFWSLLMVLMGPGATVALVLLLHIHQLNEIHIWYVPLYMMIAVAAAGGIATVAGGGRSRRLAAAILAPAAVVWTAASNFGAGDRRGYYYAEDFASDFLRTMEYEGLNVMYERGSLGTYETAYLKKVEGVRPDHVFVDGAATVYYDYKEFAYGRYNMAAGADAAAWEEAFEKKFLAMAADGTRPVYYAIDREQVYRAGYVLEPRGILFRVAEGREPRGALSPVWGRYRGKRSYLADAAFLLPDRDVWGRTAACGARCMAARELFYIGRDKAALEELGRAAVIAGGLYESLTDIGNAYLVNGYPRRALPLYAAALKSFPRQGRGDPYFRLHYAHIIANNGMAYLSLGDLPAAAAAFRASLKAYPDQPDLYPLLDPRALAAAAETYSAHVKER